MDLLIFKNGEDMINKTGLPVDECLKIVEAEIQKLEGNRN